MLEIIFGATLAVVLFYYFIVKPYDFWKNRGVQQGNPIWVFGHTWDFFLKRQSFAETVIYVYNQCPGVRYSGVYQFFSPILLLKDPELIKQITVKDFDHFTDHRAFTQESDPLWGKNLIGLKGQYWREMRAILSPSFTSSKMKTMFVLITECAENFVQFFIKKDKETVSIELKDIFTRFTNDVIATTAFGVKVDSLAQPNNEFYLMGKKATDFRGFWIHFKLLIFLAIPKVYEFFRLNIFSNEVGAFFKRIVDDTIKTREEKGIVRPDMIHLLIEARKGIQKHEDDTIDTGFVTAVESDSAKGKIPMEITNTDITAQALIFFFAGFDSVATLMCFTAYELAVNPDVQERLKREVDSTLRDCEGKLTYEGLLKMKYMDMVILETLRKWPNALISDRVCTKPYTIEPTSPQEKPVHLEKGTLLWLPLFGIHRDPEHYPNPEQFDPERFNDENKENINPYTYMPFGLGPRNCIGSRFALLETKVLFFYILQHFELVPVEKSQIPLKISKKTFNLNADGGFWFGLKRMRK